mmetsp:Transcript_16400/g.53447  ORF Transcript_16400/g.53447 Transcript_16400/m.53447 type:complete len:218 (+) Transcript_16400:700-1353(+)|eukprot:scaffold4716_cov109-Isochrysis_galbana.AAC.7
MVVVRPHLVVHQLVQQRVDQRGVRLKGRQVPRAEPHVDGHAAVGVVAQKAAAAPLHLLGEVVVDRVHLSQRAHAVLALRHDVDHRRIRRELEQQPPSLESMRRSRRGPCTETLPSARLEAAELVLGMLRNAPWRRLVAAGSRLGRAPRRLRVFRREAPHRRIALRPLPALDRCHGRGHHHQFGAVGNAVRCHRILDPELLSLGQDFEPPLGGRQAER